VHILISVSKIYDNVNGYVAVAIVTSYSARMFIWDQLGIYVFRNMVGKIRSTGIDRISIRGASADGPAYKIHLPMMIADFWGVTDVDDTILQGCFPDITSHEIK